MRVISISVLFPFIFFAPISNSDTLPRTFNSGHIIVPGMPAQKREQSVSKSVPKSPAIPKSSSSEMTNAATAGSNEIPAGVSTKGAVIGSGNGTRPGEPFGAGSMSPFLNLVVWHAYSIGFPEHTYNIEPQSAIVTNYKMSLRLDDFEAESVDYSGSSFYRIVFSKIDFNKKIFDFLIILNPEDSYKSKIVFCTNGVKDINESCVKKEQEVLSKDLFGNITEDMRGVSVEKNEENIIKRLHSNASRLLVR